MEVTDKQIFNFSKQAVDTLTSDLKLSKVKIQLNNIEFKNLGLHGTSLMGYMKIFIAIDCNFVNNRMINSDSWNYVDNLPELKNIWDRLLFILCHEIGHLIQHTRHKKWKYRFHPSNVQLMFVSSEGYRKLKLEANADKIAVILFKKYSKELLTNVEQHAIL